MVTLEATWFGSKRFVGADSSKRPVVFSCRGQDSGTAWRSHYLLPVAVAACTPMRVVAILPLALQDLLDFEINITGEQNEDPPRCFKGIHIEYVAKGRGIKEKALTDAIQVSLNRYCSVSATVEGKAKITPSHRIVEV